MSQASSHSGHLPRTGDRTALVVTGWMTGGYFVIELLIGAWTGSVSVLSDAFHTFSAVGGVLVALVASQYAARRPDEYQSFGLLRAEIVGALFNGLFLVGMALLVFWMGVMRLRHPIHLPTMPMLAAAFGGLLTEFVALGLLYKRQKDSLNMRGAFWHVLQTFVGSFLIIISAVVIRFTGFLAIDPILGMLFGAVLLWASWGIIRASLHVLLERTPENLDLNGIIADIRAMHGVKDIHHVHAWSLTDGKNVFSAHVCLEQGADGDSLLRRIHDHLKSRHSIYFSTVQIERTCLDSVEDASEIDITRNTSHHQ